MVAKNYVGKQVTIKAGTRVNHQGATVKRRNDSVVTIRSQEPARNGKTRIYWKSNGYPASTLV